MFMKQTEVHGPIVTLTSADICIACNLDTVELARMFAICVGPCRNLPQVDRAFTEEYRLNTSFASYLYTIPNPSENVVYQGVGTV